MTGILVEEAARIAVASLVQRKVNPKLKDGITKEQAIKIVISGYPNAIAGEAITFQIEHMDKQLYKKLPDIIKHAERAAKQLKALRVALNDCEPNVPESLVISVMIATGTTDNRAARETAYAIQNTENAIIKLAEDATELRKQISRQNIGKAPEADFIRELVYIWRAITGDLPRRSNDQAETPFHAFASTLCGSDCDLSRQIKTALKSLDKEVLAAIEATGNVPTFWDRGEPG